MIYFITRAMVTDGYNKSFVSMISLRYDHYWLSLRILEIIVSKLLMDGNAQQFCIFPLLVTCGSLI